LWDCVDPDYARKHNINVSVFEEMAGNSRKKTRKIRL